jgi:hypothetical protein
MGIAVLGDTGEQAIGFAGKGRDYSDHAILFPDPAVNFVNRLG